MLEILRIKNLALIEDMSLEFGPGLNVLTGESGAGKSFILKALDFLLGERLETTLVRPGADQAMVEALFITEGEELILRRVLNAQTGRSRMFINDQLGSQERVRALAPTLLLHTSQHSQQELLDPASHARILDGFMNRPELTAEADSLVRDMRAAIREREALDARLAAAEERREMLLHQREIIDKVAPMPGEEEELEAQREEAKRDAALRQATLGAQELLDTPEEGLLAQARELERRMDIVANADPSFAGEREQVAGVVETLQELLRRLYRLPLPTDERAMEAVESRLWALAQLRRTLRRSMEEIFGLREEIASTLSLLDAAGLDRQRMVRREKEAKQALGNVLERLNQARREAADELTRRLALNLQGLGFSAHVQVQCAFSEQEIFPGLVELRPRLTFSPNPGQPPQPLDAIASGGELSRFLLAVVELLAGERLPTLLFDEVDSGIGGMVLNRVGERLRSLSTRHQILFITHWPQLAALGERCFLVEKEVVEGKTSTRCRELVGQELEAELARMAGGGEQGRSLARHLVRERDVGSEGEAL